MGFATTMDQIRPETLDGLDALKAHDSAGKMPPQHLLTLQLPVVQKLYKFINENPAKPPNAPSRHYVASARLALDKLSE